MADIIDHIASLIDVRGRNDREFTLACMMFEFLEASALKDWRADRRDETPAFELGTNLIANSWLSPSSRPSRAR